MFQRYTTTIYNSFKTLSANICMMSEKGPLKKPRYDGRSKKRKWEERRSDYSAEFETQKQKTEERIKKRKYAMLLGYSGSNYFGMQRNEGTKTIEEELFKAFLATNHVTEEGFQTPQSIQFQRAARTDKGVSAARQVVSLKLPETVDIQKINDNLPEVIRVFSCKRATKGFNSKSQCDARTYLYMVPTIAFSKDSEQTNITDFRLSRPAFEKINEILGRFVGTKNYHNFTSKMFPNDPRCKRYILSFICEEPIIRKDIEFVVLKVKGQSFILHQIRKMVGLTIALLRGYANDDIFAKAFTLEKVNISRAPGLGLVLDFVHYDRYNKRYGTDGIHETLEWKECDDVVNDFKEKYIYPTIIDTEINDNNILVWLEKLAKHSFDVTDENEQQEESNEENEDDDDAEEEPQCKKEKGENNIETLDSNEDISVEQNIKDSTNCVEDKSKVNDKKVALST